MVKNVREPHNRSESLQTGIFCQSFVQLGGRLAILRRKVSAEWLRVFQSRTSSFSRVKQQLGRASANPVTSIKFCNKEPLSLVVNDDEAL